MAKINVAPPEDVVDECLQELKELDFDRLNHLYQEFWECLCTVEDQDSAEADQYWGTVFAIEALQDYKRYEVNKVRNGQKQRR